MTDWIANLSKNEPVLKAAILAVGGFLTTSGIFNINNDQLDTFVRAVGAIIALLSVIYARQSVIPTNKAVTKDAANAKIKEAVKQSPMSSPTPLLFKKD